MRSKYFSLIAGLALASSISSTAMANDYGIPADIQDSNILHCFNWTFSDIIKELPNIAEAGFGSIQVSPVQGNAATGAEWFYAYMPYDFKFKANGNGSRAQLQQLCKEADKYGIKIIVDVVANHVNQASGYHDSWWDSNGRVRWNGGVDYNNRYSITHGQLGEYGDVNSEASEVQARAKAFLEDLKSIGVKGIRWDAAKHIGLPSEGCNFWSQMASVAGLWHYGEVLDGPGGDKYKLLKEYTNYIGVSDSEYSKWTRSQVMSGNVPSGGGSWTANNVPSEGIVYWAESHDDYSNDGQYGENTALMPQDRMDRAYAITACRNGETSLYFSRPAATTRNTIKMGQKGSTHFTSKEIAEVNKFRNAMVGTKDYYTASNGVACITRQGGGAVIVIGAGGSRNVSVANGGGYVPAGQYTDRVSGNKFTVTSSNISGQVGNTGIAVIYGNVTREASVTFSPNGGEFNETVKVTITPENATSAWFKIGNGQQISLTSPTTITLGADMQVNQSVTISWSATGDEGTKTGSVTFKKVEKIIPVNPYVYFDNTANWSAPTVWAWNDAENCNSNGTWPGDKMERQSDGKWLWTAPDGKTPTFIIFSNSGNSQTDNLTFVNGATYKADGSYTTSGGGGGGDIIVTPPADMPESLYVIGNIPGASWSTSQGLPMVKTGNTFVIDNITFTPADDNPNQAYFNLSEKLADNWDALNSSANRFGATAQNAPLALNGSAAMKKYALNVDASGCQSWAVTPGTYSLIADFSSMSVKLLPAGTTGVESVETADESEPIYFTLQGVRVERPEAGLYIVVRSGKASKVLVR